MDLRSILNYVYSNECQLHFDYSADTDFISVVVCKVTDSGKTYSRSIPIDYQRYKHNEHFVQEIKQTINCATHSINCQIATEASRKE